MSTDSVFNFDLLTDYTRSGLSLLLEGFFKEKAKENLVIAADMTNQKLGNSTGLQKSAKALDSVDTKKELSKLAGVSHDIIYLCDAQRKGVFRFCVGQFQRRKGICFKERR